MAAVGERAVDLSLRHAMAGTAASVSLNGGATAALDTTAEVDAVLEGVAQRQSMAGGGDAGLVDNAALEALLKEATAPNSARGGGGGGGGGSGGGLPSSMSLGDAMLGDFDVDDILNTVMDDVGGAAPAPPPGAPVPAAAPPPKRTSVAAAPPATVADAYADDLEDIIRDFDVVGSDTLGTAPALARVGSAASVVGAPAVSSPSVADAAPSPSPNPLPPAAAVAKPTTNSHRRCCRRRRIAAADDHPGRRGSGVLFHTSCCGSC